MNRWRWILIIKPTTFNNQPNGGRASTVTLAERPSRGEYSCCHRAPCLNTSSISCLYSWGSSEADSECPLSPASWREWQQTSDAAEQAAQRVTVLALPPLGWLLDVVGFMIKIHLQRFIIPEAWELHVVGFGNQYCWCDIGINLVMMCD